MNIEQASVFLAGSILTMLGFISLVIGVIVINNLLHKFWKPVTVVIFRNESVYPTLRFSNIEDNKPIEPSLDRKQNIDKSKV